MEGKTRHRWEERGGKDGWKEEAKMGGKTRSRWEKRLDTDGREDEEIKGGNTDKTRMHQEPNLPSFRKFPYSNHPATISIGSN